MSGSGVVVPNCSLTTPHPLRAKHGLMTRLVRHTTMRTLAPALVAVLVVLSGCSVLGGPSTASPTPEPTADEVPGIEDGRLTDRSALVAAHREALVRTGFRTDFRVNVTVQRRGQVYSIPQRQVTLAEPGVTEYRYQLVSQGGSSTRFDVWGNRSVEALRVRTGDTTRYRTGPSASAKELTGAIKLSTYLSLSNFTASNVYRANNDTFVELRAGEPRNVRSVLPENATNVSDYRATAVVDSEGRVREFRMTVHYTIGGEPGVYTVGFDVLRLDRPALSRPDWAVRALRS